MRLKEYLKITDIAHFIGGILINFFPIHISIILVVLFVLYQFDEDWYLKDRAYRDIAEFMVGVYIGAIITVLEKIFIVLA